MDCQRLDDIYELFLLGALEGGEAEALHEHLEKDCVNCLGRLRDAARTVYFLTLFTRPARPDPKTKARILERIRRSGR